jgi:hypothetical protein
MSNLNMPMDNVRDNKKWLVLIIVLVIVVGVGATYYFINKKETAPTPVVVEESDGFPEVFYSYTGAVKEVTGDRIIITAEASKNYLKTDTEIQALYDKETEFIEVVIPKTIENAEGQISGTLFQRTKISSEAIKAGDRVTVIAYENVKGKTEFKARKIEVTAE